MRSTIESLNSFEQIFSRNVNLGEVAAASSKGREQATADLRNGEARYAVAESLAK